LNRRHHAFTQRWRSFIPPSGRFIACQWWRGAGLHKIHTSQAFQPPHFKEFMMQQRLIHRAFSFALAAIVTLGTLGGIDQLWQPAAAAPQWAQQSQNDRA